MKKSIITNLSVQLQNAIQRTLLHTLLHTLLYIGVFFCANIAYAQEQFSIKETLNWQAAKDPQTAFPAFEGAIGRNDRHLPTFQTRIPLSGYSTLQVEVVSMNYERCNNAFVTKYASEISRTPPLEQEVSTARHKVSAYISVYPFRKNGSQIERVTSFELRVTATPAAPLRNPPPPVTTSELASGDVYKIAISETGIHKLDYNFLKNTLGITNLDAIDPRNIQVLGNGGGTVPESNSAAYPDDLGENAVMIAGENDGKFDANDYVLFYAQAASVWHFDPSDRLFKRYTNPYSTKNYYFIKIGASAGKRIAASPRTSVPNTDATTTNYDAIKHYEKDAVNLLNEPDENGNGKGSGRQFVDGDYFKYTLNKSYSGFNFDHINTAFPVRTQLCVGIKSVGASSNFELKANGTTVMSSHALHTSGQALAVYADTSYKTGQFSTNTGNIAVDLNFIKGAASATGFLDYITMQARCNLHFDGGQFAFRDAGSNAVNSMTYQFDNDFNASVWEVTTANEPILQEVLHQNNKTYFGATTNGGVPREFVAHDGNYNTPEAVGKVTPQNLHGLATPNMVIIYNPSVSKAAAERLAQHRRTFSNLTVETINIYDIYNEFSTGKQDIGAIRNLARMFYNRADGANFRYLLLFGDASYDYRNLEGAGDNVVPTYESAYSLDEISSFATDDFFGLLDANEGNFIESGGLDIAIGRLPVTTPDSAAIVVNKIIRYDTNRDMLGDWINRASFAADDPDGGWNGHFDQANPIADSLIANVPRLNLDKIYLDAYQQISGAGGDRYPDAVTAIDNTMYKGTLVFNYAGHGGPEGLAQERIVRPDNLLRWTNDNAMPLCVTASCSVGHYDDPNELSIGEKMLLQEHGGMIALFTTIRPVNAYDNKVLNTNVFKVLTNGQLNVTMGEALQQGKNLHNTGSNGRKFLMLGDPAQILARPEYPIFTTKINSHSPNAQGEFADTLHALEQITIEGEVRDASGNALTSFNGTAYPTIFDKKTTQYTLGNDGNGAVVPFTVQKNILFKGNATVVNGKFSFTFVVPKDINYQIGFGKISYYAKQNNSILDAGGYDYRLKVGGTGTPVKDDAPPIVKLFMNDDKFLSGGITNEKPLLIAKLSDDTGINAAGAGIGHDITAVLDENTQGAKVLNDFFETDANTSKKGTVRYPLTLLSAGKHTITVKCWDVMNKSGQDKIEFTVEKQANLELAHVLNYPNPFSVQTSFQFEHNKPGVPLYAQIQIFTVSGKLVKTIERNIISTGFRVSDIVWDATDDYGDRLANGVYVYRVNVSYPNSLDGGTSSLQGNWEKLVLFK